MKYFLFSLIFVPCTVFAHGSGFTIEQEAGDYVLSLHGVSSELAAGNAERLNVEIQDKTSSSTVRFSDVWMSITAPSGAFLFAGNLENKEPLGLVTGISYLFPRAGTYDISVRFLDGEKTLAGTSFALPVAKGRTGQGFGGGTTFVLDTYGPWAFLAIFAIGIIVGKLFSLVGLKPWSRKQ